MQAPDLSDLTFRICTAAAAKTFWTSADCTTDTRHTSDVCSSKTVSSHLNGIFSPKYETAPTMSTCRPGNGRLEG
jgi:hypothetical protein